MTMCCLEKWSHTLIKSFGWKVLLYKQGDTSVLNKLKSDMFKCMTLLQEKQDLVTQQLHKDNLVANWTHLNRFFVNEQWNPYVLALLDDIEDQPVLPNVMYEPVSLYELHKCSECEMERFGWTVIHYLTSIDMVHDCHKVKEQLCSTNELLQCIQFKLETLYESDEKQDLIICMYHIQYLYNILFQMNRMNSNQATCGRKQRKSQRK